MKKDPYARLLQLAHDTALLQSVGSLLDWDRETYMPHDAVGIRGEQMEILSILVHRSRTNKVFAKTLESLINLKTGDVHNPNLSTEKKAELREFRRDYLNNSKLPNAFVKKFSKVTSAANHAWKVAKNHNDFSHFAPHLAKIVSLCKKKADLLGYQEHPYDALLDLYEPDMRISTLIPLFTELKLHLTRLVQEISLCPKPRQDFLHKEYRAADQSSFSHTLLKAMGFKESSSRLDLTIHPFCTGLHPTDIRMTTRIHPEMPLSNIFAVLHEGGHGLYEMHLNPKHFGSPLGSALSYGIHESQSRFWETLIGHSHSFWEHFFPLLKAKFPTQLGNVHLNDFYQAINTVSPGQIRIEADEVTYNLHIILRFEIEKALLEGSLDVKDVPNAWNDKMREYLGTSPAHNGEGCLQDIHWSFGGFGYFPTYTLGNLFAAQFFAAFEQAHPDWMARVAQGKLDFIGTWLKDQIHCHGRLYTSQELCQKVTGKPLSAQPFAHYLETKYRKLYHLRSC